MSIHVFKVQAGDRTVVQVIVDQLIDQEESLPSFEHLLKLLADDRTYLFAAVLDEVVIGYALAYRFPSLYESSFLAYLYDIEVLASHRRKGAGKLLVTTLLEELRLDGVGELWLGTATDNAEGQALFSSTGGIKSGETFNDFVYTLN